MNILPYVKKIEYTGGNINIHSIRPFCGDVDERIKKAIDKLPCSSNGAVLDLNIGNGDSEKYTVEIKADSIRITAPGVRGAFYAVQTLRQIFTHEEIPCLYIEDEPDFEYRGFYHDITRGKIPKVETIKNLIDVMAYYKLNALQLYVEHVFEFAEIKELIKKSGYITAEELKEIGEYCKDNFIEFTPSLSTFGHMYEILEMDKYKHLRVLKDYNAGPNFWLARMMHHTIDPLNEESFSLVTSLIDQYAPSFEDDKFNICGDETFDLRNYGGGFDTGKLYIDFIKRIIAHLEKRNLKPMMWADILLRHPEVLSELPEDIYLLNWNYELEPSEEDVRTIASLGKKQIVCPGIGVWHRFCERLENEQNIQKMAEYGYKYGAMGVLNTSWGDWGNVACLEMSMYGLVTGAAKSWAIDTQFDDAYYSAVSQLVYGKDDAMDYIKRVNDMHSPIRWDGFCTNYFEHRYGGNSHPDAQCVGIEFDLSDEQIESIQKEYKEITAELAEQRWGNDEIREELLLCAEAICIMAELTAKMAGREITPLVDVMEWFGKYKEKWLKKNKVSELFNVEKVFTYLAEI